MEPPTPSPPRSDSGPPADDASTEDGFARAVASAEPPELERYARLSVLGEGGMGIVFAALDRRLDRKVALKWVRSAAPGEHAQARRRRLLREARVIAALSHPNVVAVYDVGTVADDVYVAMELIDGVDLRRWLKAEPRTVAEIVEVFLQAAAGLAAAHAAGIVHRDFKPANVMVGRDGRARVLDFGLARAPDSDDQERAPREVAGDVTITRTGTRVGTPAYMSPEQHARGVADEASDQFSFCVALHEAIYSQRPFFGDTATSIAVAVLADDRRPVARRSDVPSWLRALLARGTAHDPADRFPNMRALAEFAARHGRSRRLPLAIGGGAVAIAAIGTIAWLGMPEPTTTCASETPLTVEWDAARREELAATFAATEVAFAASTYWTVERRIDAYTEELHATWADACSHADSDEIRDCLDERARELSAVLDVLARADAATVELAPIALGNLPRIDACRDTARRRAHNPHPEDRVLASRVAELRTRMAEARAYSQLGRIDAALATARSISSEAPAVGYPPVHAEALALLGACHSELGELESAEQLLREAIWLGESVGHDAVVADAGAELAWLRALADASDEELHTVIASAEAAARRAGETEMYGPILRNVEGKRALDRNDPVTALARFREALQFQLHSDPADPNLPSLLHNIGNAHVLSGAPELALWSYVQALELRLRHLGPDHPEVFAERQGVADALAQLGRRAEAIPLYESVLAFRERTLEADDPRLATTMSNLGQSLAAVGRDEEAIVMLGRSIALKRELGFAANSRVRTLRELALAQSHLGRTQEAIAALDEALTTIDASRPEQHFEARETLRVLADVLSMAPRDATTARAAATGERIAIAIDDDALTRGFALHR